jgi:hypothetical protein
VILLIQNSPSPSPDLKPATGSVNNTESPAPDTSSPPVAPKKTSKTNINTPDTIPANPPETGQKDDSKENCDGLLGSRVCKNPNMIACIKSFQIGMKHCSLSLSLFVILLS